jgi:hypothetical protein
VPALLIWTGLVFPIYTVSLSPPPPDAVELPLVARVYVQDTPHLNAVAGELDIWEAHRADGFVVAAITPRQRRWLRDLGYRVEADDQRTAALNRESGLDPRFYYFDHQFPNPNGLHIVDLLHEIQYLHPDLTELIDIGDAWLAGRPGEPDRDIWVIRVTNEDPSYGELQDKPAFFLSAAMHAREVTTSELAIRYLQYLTTGYASEGGYGVDADVTWLVDHHIAYLLIMHNPDGHVENERNLGNNRRKNMDSDDGCSFPWTWGVDLNRNHSFLWDCCAGSSGDPCADTYRGPSRGSEPETQAFESYFTTVMRDQNGPNGEDQIALSSPFTTTGIFIGLHSYGDLVLWPWSFDGYGQAPNAAQLRTIGRKFVTFNSYIPTGALWYTADGAVQDWVYGILGIPAFTFEVGPSSGECGGFFPSYECLDGHAGRDFWAENRPAFLYAHKIAPTPYVGAYGPDAEDLMLVGTAPSGGSPANLRAQIRDDRCCGDAPQSIAGAEYFLNAPGKDGTGIPMSPLDGDWGDLTEIVIAPVDTSELAAGQDYVLVHGQNDQGVWGPFSAVFAPRSPRFYLPMIFAL